MNFIGATAFALAAGQVAFGGVDGYATGSSNFTFDDTLGEVSVSNGTYTTTIGPLGITSDNDTQFMLEMTSPLGTEFLIKQPNTPVLEMSNRIYLKADGRFEHLMGTEVDDASSRAVAFVHNVFPATPAAGYSHTAVEINPNYSANAGSWIALAIAVDDDGALGATKNLIDAGLTTSTYDSGFTSKFKVDSIGNVTAAGQVSGATLKGTGLTEGLVVYVGASGLLSSEAALAYNPTTDVVTMSGALLVGSVTEATDIGTAGGAYIEAGTDTAVTGFGCTTYNASASAESVFYAIRGRGTHAVPAAMTVGDLIGRYSFGVQYDTTVGHINTGAAIYSTLRAISGSSTRSDISFQTGGTGSSLVERARFTHLGAFLVSLDTSGGALSSTGINGFNIQALSETTDSINSSIAVGTSTIPYFITVKGRGTFASSTPVTTGDSLGTWLMGGVHTSGTPANRGYGASVAGIAEGTFSSTSYPTRISFSTVTSSSTTLSERARIRSSGELVVGTDVSTTIPGTSFYYIQVQADAVATTAVSVASSTAGTCANFNLTRLGGTHASASAVQSGYTIGTLQFNGARSVGPVALSNCALISATASANWSNSSSPAYLSLKTTPANTTTALEHVRLTSGGDLLFSRDQSGGAVSSGGIDGGFFQALGEALSPSIFSFGVGTSVPPYFAAVRGKGTFASATAVVSADLLGSYYFGGVHTSGTAVSQYTLQTKIESYAAENWSSTVKGTYLTVGTTAKGATTVVERFRIGDVGALTLTVGANTTNLTASTEFPEALFDFSATRTWANGAITNQRSAYFKAPTIAFVSGTQTVTNAATVYIDGAPIVGASCAITYSWGLWNVGPMREDSYIEFTEIASPANPPANSYRWFAKDNGLTTPNNRTQAVIRWSDGSETVIAEGPAA